MKAAELPNSRVRECEEMGAQEECESNLAVSTRPKTPMAVQLTRAVNRFPCISAWQDRCPRIGARAAIDSVGSLVCESCTRRVRDFMRH
jgi:hypothetical protein